MGVLIPIPGNEDYLRPRIAFKEGPAEFIPYCYETDHLPCIYKIKVEEGITGYNYIPIANKMYNSSQQLFIDKIILANLDNGCSQEPKWLEPGVEIVIPMYPNISTPTP